MSSFKKLAHAIWQCKYHVIWCPKYRFKIMKGPVKKTVVEILKQLCEWKRIELLEMNVREDHVHMNVSIPPKNAVSEVVGFLNLKFFSMARFCIQHSVVRGIVKITFRLKPEMMKPANEVHHLRGFETECFSDDNYKIELTTIRPFRIWRLHRYDDIEEVCIFTLR